MNKFGKFLLSCFLLFVSLYLFLFMKKFCFLRIKISDDFYIQQKPFMDNYVLKKTDKTTLVEYVAEWRIENEYIYGSTYKGFFIYNKLTENILIFEDLHDFDKYLKKVKLIYTMDNCIGVFDYTKGH